MGGAPQRLGEVFAGDPDAFLVIAEVDGRPIGYAVGHSRLPEESWETGRIGELETLAVLPEYRGRGVGANLVDAALEEFRRLGRKHWSVTTIESNTEARRFYERLDLHRFTVSYIGRIPAAPASD